jgi:hypothetical protein
VLGILFGCLCLLWSLCAGLLWVYEAPFTLLFGWAIYLWRVIPKVHPDPWSIATAAVCLAGVAIGTHAFLRWLHCAMGSPTEEATSDPQRRGWPLKRSLQLVGLLVLMFVSGIAAMGMVHQTAWLARSPEPLLHNSWDDHYGSY